MKYFFIIFFTIIFITDLQAETSSIKLSADEKNFLKAHKSFSVHVEENYAPFSFIDNEQFKGFSVDFADLIANRLGISFTYNRNESWEQAVANIKKGKTDIIAQMIITDERKKFVHFSSSYMRYFNSIVVQKKHQQKHHQCCCYTSYSHTFPLFFKFFNHIHK